MAIWMHRNSVTKSRRHSSTFIASCCSSIMQWSAHNAWKLKTSQTSWGLCIHQTCYQLNMLLWISMSYSIFQLLPVSNNFVLLLKRSGPAFHRQCSTAWSSLWKGNVLQSEANNTLVPSIINAAVHLWYNDFPLDGSVKVFFVGVKI